MSGEYILSELSFTNLTVASWFFHVVLFVLSSVVSLAGLFDKLENWASAGAVMNSIDTAQQHVISI